MVYLLKMVIFHSYVSLPEGIWHEKHMEHDGTNWWYTYPPKNMKVRLDHNPNYWGKYKMIQTTNQWNYDLQGKENMYLKRF